MDIFVTTNAMLGTDRLKSFLQNSTKKERMLYIYHSADAVLTFADAKVLLDSAKKISVEFIVTKNPDDFAFSLGYLAGTLKNKGPIYTILPPECKPSDSICELYHLEEYRPASLSPKKKSRPPVPETAKDSTVSEQNNTNPETAVNNRNQIPNQKIPEDGLMNPPEENSLAEKDPADTQASVEVNTDPLFFSTDAETFFSKQLGMANGYKEVALCMKESSNKSKAEELIRDRVKLSGAEMERVVNAVRQKWDILYGCLFIRRR